ncbi:hypothetical protein BGZ76_009881 [Entomortierella beljakovae]|nr:hypothetical protein BGZ76_009881 [Entomortierella beljakovae]
MFSANLIRISSRFLGKGTQIRNISGGQSTLSEGALKNIRETIDQGRIQCGTVGLGVAILHKGRLVFAEGFGKRNEVDPFTSETLVPIGSLTKAFTATAIGELVADGKMDWNKTPVSTYLPEFQLKDPVLTSQLTIADLLSHRSNLTNDVDISWYKSKKNSKELIKKLRLLDVNPKLGSTCQYNNVMYGVAGEAAANVAGMSFQNLVETKIIKPLKLTNTGFSQTGMVKKSSNYAKPFSAASFEDAQQGNFTVHDFEDIGQARAPAGDMYSNILDLVRWGKAILNLGEVNGEQILLKDSVKETLTPHTIVPLPEARQWFAPSLTYGFGWMIDSYLGHKYYVHNGGTSGFTSRLDIYPEDDIVIAQLTNTSFSVLSGGVSRFIVDEILDLPRTKNWIVEESIKSTKEEYEILELSLEGRLPERIPGKPATQALEAYEGEFTNPVFGDITIRVEIDKETQKKILQCSFATFESQLNHYHFDSFVTTLRDVNFGTTDLITFRTAGNGMMEGLRFLESDFKRKYTSRTDRKKAGAVHPGV